eukprot:Em0003g1699a
MEDGRKQTEALIAAFMGQTSKRETESPSQKVAIPSFDAFDSTIEFNLASQQSPAKDVNALTLDEIFEYMKGQFDPTRYVVRERFKYWFSMSRNPGESIQELAARIRHDAVTCNFPAIKFYK